MRGEKNQAYGLLFLAIALIAAKGVSGNEAFFSSVVRNYIEETAASVEEAPVDDRRLTDISDLMLIASAGSTPKSTVIASTIQEYTLQATAPASTDYLEGFKPDQIVEYAVQSGDNISTIASDFGVSVNTIIWANNLRNPDSLNVGQTLRIPPVTGVIHKIKTGDTITSVAKKYNVEAGKILSFNDLKDGQALRIGDEIIVPGGELSGPKPSVKATNTKGPSIYKSVGDGQCVAFVQAHGFANLHGHAYQWAKYINTKTPSAGDVVVFRGGKYGHVGLITAVKAGSIQIVEQNYYGPYIIDHREISLSNKSIVGFVH